VFELRACLLRRLSQRTAGKGESRVQFDQGLNMNATNVLERVPIHTNADGVVRVAGTRVTLDTIVDAFETGATAEEIAQQYPTVPLVDVYSVITYYLRHKPEVETYLRKREDEAGRVRKEVERRFPSEGLRERLLARRR
jgi:uncharacterized protein (DUF433 family)